MRGDIRPGLALLQRAVTLAETEGYVRIFVDEGAPMHALLGHAVRTGGAAMTFRPTVLVVEPERELRWLGHLLVPGLFDGEHQFEIHSLGPGRVRFVQQERFTGVLVPLFARNLDAHTLPGFNAMNAALKARAEAAVGNQRVLAV